MAPIFGDIMGRFLAAPTLQICMFGPRGVGKTTVLTSVFKNTTDGIAGSKVYMRSGDDKCAELLEYSDLLTDAIETKNASNLPATNTVADYMFELGIIGKQPTVKLRIKDFPGEYIAENASNQAKDEVRGFINNSNIIMVAIDTPFLMEEGGKYNSEKNNPSQVIHYITHNPMEFKDKMVLFVPLKCERYFYDGRMQEVSDRVKETYGELKDFFRVNNVASAIVPILTLGGIELDRLENHPNPMFGKLAKFRMYEKNPTYNPLFCAQPIYYLLTYVGAYYDWLKRTGGMMAILRNLLMSYLRKDEDFLTEIQKMRGNIITYELGFEPFTSNSIFNI